MYVYLVWASNNKSKDDLIILGVYMHEENAKKRLAQTDWPRKGITAKPIDDDMSGFLRVLGALAKHGPFNVRHVDMSYLGPIDDIEDDDSQWLDT